jgi:eukaryotic-like serine/threonine-protein kinase
MKLDKQEWVLGPFLDGGTYGKVHLGESLSGEPVAIKLIANRPGADRELLFDGAGKRNVIPILDSGTHGNDYVIVMPRAEKSLLDHLKDSGGTLPLEECVKVLTGIATALADLDGGIVHRDLKPGNVLLWNGTWHLADFGTARFADAETETHTAKNTGTTPYFAPERWLLQRATIAADVYAVGVMAFEMYSGARPFPGPGRDDFRDQHVGRTAPALTNAPTSFAALVAACLFKSPQTRPTPENLLARLGRISQPPAYPGLAGLVQANQSAVAQKAAAQALASSDQAERDRQTGLLHSAHESFALISEELRTAITETASDGTLTPGRSGWIFQLGAGELHLSSVEAVNGEVWRNGTEPPFAVIAHATLTVKGTPPVRNYAGRRHSLWFCDAQHLGQYGWFETAFMWHPMKAGIFEPYEPFAMAPDATSRAALGPSTAVHQVAWPFTEVEAGDLEEFITRWANWLVEAQARRLNHPAAMPERPVKGSWRPGTA